MFTCVQHETHFVGLRMNPAYKPPRTEPICKWGSHRVWIKILHSWMSQVDIMMSDLGRTARTYQVKNKITVYSSKRLTWVLYAQVVLQL